MPAVTDLTGALRRLLTWAAPRGRSGPDPQERRRSDRVAQTLSEVARGAADLHREVALVREALDQELTVTRKAAEAAAGRRR